MKKQSKNKLIIGSLAEFYDISTIEGYLIPNPVYTDIKYIRFVNELFVDNIL